MRFHPTRIHRSLPALSCLFILAIVLGCSKDPDILSEAKFVESQEEVVQSDQGSQEEDTADAADEESTDESADETTSGEESNEDTTEDNPDGGLQEEGASGIEEGFETRFTSFPPTDDAYLQSGKGINENLIRLEEGSRTSYLMFDLSPIGEIGGYITDARLQFTVTTDGGDGEVAVYKGLDNNWNESELDFENAPESDILLGSINDTYVAGSTQEVVLSSADMVPERTTLILFHANGNDLALASKEHPSKAWPKLVVSYNAPQDAKEVSVEDPVTDTTSQDDTAGEEETTGGAAENQAPVAVATATPVNGKAPLEVAFEGKDSSDDQAIQAYAWDFKDGAASTAINPTHTFTEPGTYNVSLSVTDSEGLSNVDVVTITVQEPDNQAPSASASASVTSGAAPLDVQFNADASSDDKDIVSYYWDFSTDDPSSAKNPSRTFTEPGEYVVTLTVTDAEGLEDSDSITITVSGSTQNQAPVARIEAAPISGQAPLTVNFDAGTSTDDSGISSYSWDFGNTETGSGASVSNTFNYAGSYTTTLTVTDNQGMQSTATVTVTVESASGGTGGSGNTGGTGGGSVPDGYYVTPNGSAYANGLSENSAWSLEHAFDVAKPGDVIYVKSGSYGNKQLILSTGGSTGNTIKFIGYTNVPGDLISNNGSTFSYGDQLNPNMMPLLSGPNGQGTAITIRGHHVEIHNFQINGYKTGIQTNSAAYDIVLKNIIVANVGDQNNYNAYDGFGFDIRGRNSLIEDCFVLNAAAEAFTLFDADNSRVRFSKAYSNNANNPTDYYFLITGGTNSAIIEHSYAERARGLNHGGHGFDIKDLGENNIVRNSTARGTNFELNFSGVRFNTFENCTILGYGTGSGEWHSRLLIANGANNNLIRNMEIKNTWAAVFLNDYDDGYVGPGGDRDLISLGYDNTIDGMRVNNTQRVLNIGTGNSLTAVARNYTFRNSEFVNFDIVAVVNLKSENFRFENCSFSNGNELYFLGVGQFEPYSSFSASWTNCTWTNVGFTPPN